MLDKKKVGFCGERMIVIPKKIIKNIRKNILTKSLYITDIGYFPNAENHYRKRIKGTKENILIYAIKGEGVVEIENNKFRVFPNNFIIIPAKKVHKYFAKETNPWSIYWIHFTGELSKELINKIYINGNIQVLDTLIIEDRISIFEEIYRTIELGYSDENIYHSMFTLWHLLSSLIFSNEYSRIKGTKNEDQVETVIKFMRENVHKTYSNDSFAKMVNLSISHLSKLFKEKTGYAPMEFYIQLKIQKACLYLTSTNYKIKEIADSLNYDDPYYFSRVFTKFMGISPRRYRNKHLYDL